MAGESISLMGSWMQQMAQGWVMTGLTTSAFTLGIMNFAAGLPALIFTLHGGVLADRYDKRTILIVAQVVQIVLALVLGWLVAVDEIAVWHVLVCGVLLGLCTAFEMPAAAALVPELVPKAQFASAIAVDRAAFHLTRLAGPAIGGWLIGQFGTASAFFVNAASFVALIIALLTLHPRPQGSDEEETQRRTGMKEGLAYVRRDPPTLAMVILLATATLCVSPFFLIMMPLYSRHVLGVDAQSHGLLMAASGVGAFIGSIWLLTIASPRRLAYLRGAVVLLAACMLSLAGAQRFWQAAVSMVLLALGSSTMYGLANTIVQERAPDAIRGRVSAIMGMSFFGILPASGLLMSKFADVVGMRIAMGSSGTFFGLASAAVLFLHRAVPLHRASAASSAPPPEPR